LRINVSSFMIWRILTMLLTKQTRNTASREIHVSPVYVARPCSEHTATRSPQRTLALAPTPCYIPGGPIGLIIPTASLLASRRRRPRRSHIGRGPYPRRPNPSRPSPGDRPPSNCHPRHRPVSRHAALVRVGVRVGVGVRVRARARARARARVRVRVRVRPL